MRVGHLGVCGCLLVAVAGCGPQGADEATFKLSGQTMGTRFSIEIVDASTPTSQQALKAATLDALAAVDALASTYRSDSELSRLNEAGPGQWVPISAELCALLSDALELGERTDGAFDITLGRLINLWGFGSQGTVSEPPAQTDIDAMNASQQERFELDCIREAARKLHWEVELDLSAFAKGVAVDRVAEAISALGFTNFLVEVGGELRAHGHNARQGPWTIAIESPTAGERRVHSFVRVKTPAAIATSGDYRNFFEHDGVRYSHTLDPRTGRPVTHAVGSVTVIARTAAIADAFATALLVLGTNDGLELAARERIAACFLSRTAEGLDQICSPDFQQWQDATNESDLRQ